MTLHQYQLSERDESDPVAKKHPKQDGFEGVTTKRHSTDVLFIIAMILMWAAMTYVGARAIKSGNPYRLVSPINDQGQVCGQTDAVKNEKYFTSVMTLGVGVCVSGCESTNASFTSTDVNDYYCLSYVHQTFPNSILLSGYIQSFCFTAGSFDMTSNCGCMLKLQTSDAFYRCSFTDPAYRAVVATQAIKDYLVNFIGDVLAVRHIVFGYTIGLSFVLGFLWITVLRFEWLSSIVVWSALVAILVLLVIMCIISYLEAKEWTKEDPQLHTDQEVLGLRVVAGLFMGLAVVWAIFTCCFRSAVNLALKVMALSAECIEDMPLIVLTPVVQILSMVCFMVPWIIYCFFIASSGNLVAKSYTTSLGVTLSYTSYELNQREINILWFLFFCYLWTMDFIGSVGQLIMATAVSRWYFSVPDQRTVYRGSAHLTNSYGTILRYHLGTAAFGSLVVAIIEFIRYFLLYIERHSKYIADNPFGRCLFGCINCCLLCVEKIIRFISKQAYIQTAIHGTSFCGAAKDAFFLICRNILRIGALHVVSGIAMWIGKILVVVAAGATSYYIFATRYQDELNGTIAPTLLCMIVAFSIAAMFTDVFSTAVDTTLQCYVTDEEFNGGKPKFASPSMKNFIEEHAITQEEFDKHNPRKSKKTQEDAKGDFSAVATTGVGAGNEPHSAAGVEMVAASDDKV